MENGQEVERRTTTIFSRRVPIRLALKSRTDIQSSPWRASKSLGWDKDLTPQEMEIIQRVNSANPDACPGRWTFPAGFSAWRSTMAARPMQRQSANDRMEPADPIPVHREPIYTPRPDLVADYPTLPTPGSFRVPNIASLYRSPPSTGASRSSFH